MAQTAFKQVKNNAKSTLNGAISSSAVFIPIQAGNGSRFPQPGNGFWATIWNQGLYQDPSDDPGMEVVLVTARSVDILTVIRGQLGTSASAHSTNHAIRQLVVDQQINDIHTSINNLDLDVIHSTGDETIAGTKTFNSSPIVPIPTAPTQAASKTYVDSTVGSSSTPDADSSTKGKVQLSGGLGGKIAGASGTAASPILKDLYKIYNVYDYGAIGDGVTNDLAAIQAAINAAAADGGGVVFFPAGTYMVNNRIAPKSNVTLLGVKYSSIIKISINDYIIVCINAVLTNFSIDSMTFQGPVNEFPTSPKRTRTTSGNGAITAVYISGDGDPFQVGALAVSNITMRDCKVENCTALPIRIAGTTGTVKVTECDFINNQDPGFIFNEEVIFSNNHSMMGADNGVSLSRGNRKITCTGNTIENVAFQGIFVAGFDINSDGDVTNIGPTNFTITGNTIKNCGYNAIFLDGAPKHGVVAGNMIQQGYFRGPAGISPSDINSVGIYIAGYPFPYTSLTAYAEDIQVTGNVIYQCARAGVEIFGAKNIDIDSNIIMDCGSQFLADGSTAVGSTSTTSNVGILLRSSPASTNITVRNNTITDNRGTPYTNYGIVPFTQSAIPTTFEYANNRMTNCRNAYNLIDFSSNEHIYAGAAAIYTAKGLNDAHNNRVLTITDNASVTPNFVNMQGSIAGQPVAFAAESFTETTIPMTFRTKGAATLAFRPGTDLVTAIQFRRDDNVSANSVMNIDTTNARVGVNTIAPASSFHVVGTIRGTDLLLTNPVPVASGGTGQANLTSLPLTTPQITNGLNDSAGNRMITFTATASAVTNLGIQNAATGGTLALAVTSTDTNAGMTFKSKGNGTLAFRPETDTTIASQWRKGDNASVVMNVDTTNGRVGVATTLPTRTLDVMGIAKVQAMVGYSSGPPTAVLGAGLNGGGTGAPTVTVTGSNLAGKIVAHAGTGGNTANAIVATITFGTAATTIAAGSNGAVLPQATINVASTTGFPAFGSFTVGGDTVTYTGITATSFTGCSGGTATLATSNPVVATPAFAFPVAPYVILTPAVGTTAALPAAGVVFVDQGSTTTTSFVLKVGSTAITDGADHIWNYMVGG